MSEAKHTPQLPFKLGGCSGRMICDREGHAVADCDLFVHAEFIVLACNSHDALVAACEKLRQYNQEDDCRRRVELLKEAIVMAEAALAQAKKE